MKSKDKLLCLMMAFLMLILSIPPIEVYAASNEPVRKVTAYAGDSVTELRYDGKAVLGSSAWYIDKYGKEMPAYCMDPKAKGPGEVSGRKYDLDIRGANMDVHAAGCILEGYPYKTPDELGLSTVAEAYAATKAAIWSGIYNSPYKDVSKWTSSNPKVLEAMKGIIDRAKNHPEIVLSTFSIEKVTEPIDDGNFTKQTFKPISNYPIMDYDVAIKGSAPEGTTVTKSGDTYTVSIPNKSITAPGNVEAEVLLKLKSDVVLYGDPIDITGVQRLEIPMIPWETLLQSNTPYSKETGPDPTPEMPGKIKIIKTAYGSNKGLPGARFRVEDHLGGVLGIFTTGSDGTVTVQTNQTGAHGITEIVAPEGYAISENYHQDVRVDDNRETIVYFANKKLPTLEIIKEDASDGSKRLPGATFTVSLDGGTESFDVTTGPDGSVTISEGLKPDQTYKIVEKTAPKNYLLNTKPVFIKLLAGEKQTVTISNKHKPGLIIRKYDMDTAELLPDTEISVRYKGGSIIWEGLTNEDGEVFIENIDIQEPGQWIEVIELAPSPGYIGTTEKKEVYLKPGQEEPVVVKLDNRKKPILTVLKVDESGKGLPDAVIHVKKTEGETISEYITPTSGELIITLDEEAIYSIWEEKAPDGYIKDETCHTDIKMSAGEKKQIIFTNRKKPSIEILKVDSVTKRPIPSTKYKLTEVESETVSEKLTDANGKVTFDNLNESIYKIEETIANDAYILNTEPKEILAKGHKQLIFENIRKPRLIVSKLSGLDYKPVPNTIFSIKYEGTNGTIEDLGRHRTGTDGRIVINNAKVGWYQIEEVQSAPGMNPPSNPITRVYLKPGENAYSEEELGNGSSNGGNTGGGNGASSGNSEVKAQSGYDFISNGTEIVNWPKNSIVVKKHNAGSNARELLAGATFELYKVTGNESGTGGTLVKTATTDGSGIIVFTGLDAGAGYVVKESSPPPNFTLSENNQQQAWLKADATSIIELSFANYPYGSLLVTKVNAQNSGEFIPGIKFKVTTSDGSAIGNANGIYETDANGTFLIPNIPPGTSVVVTELDNSSKKWVHDSTPQTIVIGNDGGTYKLTFKNQPYGTLVLKKWNSADNSPLADAELLVKYSDGTLIGDNNGIFRTNAQGTVIIPGVYGSIVVQETKAPPNFTLSQQTQTIFIDYGETKTLDFYNAPKGNITVTKYGVDSNGAKHPLDSCTFVVERANGERIGTYVTKNGHFTIPYLEPGHYKCYEIETKSQEYQLDSTPQSFEVTPDGKPVNLTFYNYKKSGVLVRKYGVSANDVKKPLDGCKFRLERSNGELIGNYETVNGGFTIPNLSPGEYVLYETESVSPFLVDSTPKRFTISNEPKMVELEFLNYEQNGLLVKKYGLDEQNNRLPLPGVTMRVIKKSGDIVGDFVTSTPDGIFTISHLEPGWYSCFEISAGNTGYALDPTPQDFEITKGGELVTLEFVNKKLAGLHLKKISSVDRSPIADIPFILTKLSGERIGDVYKTSKSGEIFISNLEPGTYILQEQISEGYIPDTEPRTFELKLGETKLIEWENTPISCLEILKTSENDGRPLKGVLFEIRKSCGELVGNDFKTDEKGRIYVVLEPGEYHITELEPLPGFEKNDEIYKVNIRPGHKEILRIKNREMGGLRIFKYDSVTGLGIYNTEFRVYDFITNKEVGGPYYSDDKGIVDFTGILPEGRYKILESREAPGYLRGDDIYRTIEIVAGKITEIKWANSPQLGQVRVLKTSASANEVNGLPKNTPLGDAVFEISHYKTGEVIDQFKTGPDGWGTSKPIPIGRWLLKEVSAPKYYKISDQVIDFEIEFSSQIVKFEFTNEPANTGVSIKKIGPAEAISGQQIQYDFKVIQNTSTVPLSDFYVRDVLPGNALQADKIVTGSYNQALKYKIMYKTNKNDYRVLADNLSTTQNNVVNCSPVALGLFSDEFITEIMFVYGNVKAGFSMVDTPSIYATVKPGLPAGFQFANRCDVGGKYANEWIIGNAVWVTTLYGTQPNKLPKTGY